MTDAFFQAVFLFVYLPGPWLASGIVGGLMSWRWRMTAFPALVCCLALGELGTVCNLAWLLNGWTGDIPEAWSARVYFTVGPMLVAGMSAAATFIIMWCIKRIREPVS